MDVSGPRRAGSEAFAAGVAAAGGAGFSVGHEASPLQQPKHGSCLRAGLAHSGQGDRFVFPWGVPMQPGQGSRRVGAGSFSNRGMDPSRGPSPLRAGRHVDRGSQGMGRLPSWGPGWGSPSRVHS